MMSVEQSVECLAGETAVLEENLPQFRSVHHKSHMKSPKLEPGPQRWEASNKLPKLQHDPKLLKYTFIKFGVWEASTLKTVLRI
jgi:hypothetical protein